MKSDSTHILTLLRKVRGNHVQTTAALLERISWNIVGMVKGSGSLKAQTLLPEIIQHFIPTLDFPPETARDCCVPNCSYKAQAMPLLCMQRATKNMQVLHTCIYDL